MKARFLPAATLLWLAAVPPALAGGPVDDPSRPYPGFMKLYAETRGFSVGRPAAARPTPDGRSVLFLRAPPGRIAMELVEMDVLSGKARVLLTPDQVLGGAAEELTAEEKARRERMRVTMTGFTSYGLSRDGNTVLLQLSGKLYAFRRDTAAVKALPVTGSVLDPQLSRDGSAVTYVRENDVHVMDVATGKETRLTKGGNPDVTHGLAEFVAQEEMGRMHGTWWSPDGKLLAWQEADSRALEEFNIQDPMHPETPAVKFRYPRAGRNNAVVKLGITPVAGGKTTWVSWDAARWPYLAHVTWPAKGPLTVVVQSRDQRDEAVLAVDVKTGTTRVLLEEKDAAWINLVPEMPRWLEDGSGFLWMTERNGGWELELRKAGGELVRTVVPVSLGLRALEGVDEKARAVFVTAGEDPTMNALYRVGMDDGAVTRISSEDGMRTIEFSDDGSSYVETLVSRAQWRQVRVFTADGKQRAEMPFIGMLPPFIPHAEWMKVGEGAGFHAVVVRPRAFDANRKYPVVLSVYGGPRHNVVVSAREAYLREQWIADHGFIVVSLDGRGTQHRGRAWERAISGDFATVPLQDQVAGLKLVAQRVPQADLGRVGVMGWSFGGFLSALAVLKRPDVFKVGVAGAPVVEWQDYDTHYTERYLGLPDGNMAGYRASNLLTHAAELQRPLLLVHGTADDNVYFFHSLKLSSALLRAGKPHDFLPLAGFTHMVPEPTVVEKLWERQVAYLSAALHP